MGSPLADYDKLGSDERETYDTRPDKADARARGKVYVYYSKPAVQVRSVSPEKMGQLLDPFGTKYGRIVNLLDGCLYPCVLCGELTVQGVSRPIAAPKN